jgi:membrane protein
LLAGGLAYAALFAIVPAVVLLAVVAGMFINDPATRASVIGTIATVLPPVSELANAVADEVTKNAAPGSILGIVALIWGASRFAVAFQDAIARVTGGLRRRSVLRSNLDALLAVLLLVGAIIGSTLLAGIAAFLDLGRALPDVAGIDRAVGLAFSLVPILVAMVAVAAVYRIVPIPGPAWRSLLLPATVIGLTLTVLLRLFVFIAPRLIGAAALLGTLASVFAALAWLALSFQALLLGAAWTTERELERTSRAVSGRAAEGAPPR